ncbi:hypothetical protein Glove_543g12 [Diversispora epigaea]|uniref:Uncharacterized protein n=1 Tax=Diversispora epigaea TaxID=1348612 RepID=A0A397GCA1_9GLOM|nr:hypothetical protein Glove_543g12 [Diversispora epigaea]
MSKRKTYQVSLVSLGSLNKNLHFGPFSQNWWEIFLQNTEFITTTVQGCNGFLQQPGYICEAKNTISNIFDNPSAAITTLYQQLFGSKTRFSGSLIMGHDKTEINKQLLTGVTFQQFYYAGTGFKSSFYYTIGVERKRTLFVQEICKKKFIVNMYQDFELKSTYIDNSPDDVWQKVEVLQEHKGTELFGICHPEVQAIFQKLQEPKCKPEEWYITGKMQILWNYHLRKFTLASIQWNQFFISWYNEQKSIIELITSLKKLYPPNYIFKEREMRAWKAMLSHAGCTNITPYTKKISNVAHGTIFEARKYAQINGPDKANVIMSSYKTDAKTGQPVFYLKNTKNILWEKFKESFPNGLKRTTFYTKLMGHQYVYREDLGGLCATCSTYGYETFEDIVNLIKEKIKNIELQNTFFQHCNSLKRYLKKEYEEHLIVTDRGISLHNLCINHCLQYAFNECNTSHPHVCIECQELFQFFQNLKTNLEQSCHEEVQEYYNKILYYYAHQTRKVYLNAQFNAALLDLDENGAILVIDYKMKILPKTSRETKQEFFGKKGWTLHTMLVYTKSNQNSEINIQAIDHWSIDARQDAWFSASSLHSAIENLEIKPKWISIISDNGPHYHNSELMIIMSKWFEWYGIYISLSIKRYIKIGGEIQEGNDITLAIQDVAGTSVAHIEPNRNRGKKSLILNYK